MNSEPGSPREHEPVDNTRDMRIDEALSLFSMKLKSVIREERAIFRTELEDQVSSIKWDIILKRPEDIGQANFKYSGCKSQFDFNSKRIAELKLVEDLMKSGRNREAGEVLNQTLDSLAERNTHVRIADKYGWDTLEEYLGDDLVDGPDESAKLRKAESRAIKRRKEKRPYDRNNDLGQSAVMFRLDSNE